MTVLEYNKLSLGSKNSTVDAFKTLVEECLGSDTKTKQRSVVASLPDKYESELDRELYDKAADLPEAKTVSFKYLDNKSDILYGVFKGSSIYKDFSGTIDSSKKGTGNQYGWLIIDRSSDKYCLFVNYGSNSSVIISIDDFEVQQLIEDLSPLYDKLKERKYEFDESFIKDTQLSTSLAVSMKDYVSDILSERKSDNEDSTSWSKLPTGEITIRDKLFNIWKMYLSAYLAVGEFSLLIQQIQNGEFTKDPRSFNIFPAGDFTNVKDTRSLSDFSKFSIVQAIVYDIPAYFGDTGVNRDANSKHMLVCFQQPESVSYTSSASYESVSPRGSQIPYQYYQNASQIELTFELKWHIDELRSLNKDITLEHVERIAESFNRPWETENGSLVPKVCGVILPGISRVGYISSVSVTHGGSMTGKYTSDVREADDSGLYNGRSVGSSLSGFMTDYYYSELTITFSMILLQDVTLHSTDEDPEKHPDYKAINNMNSIINDKLNVEAAEKDLGFLDQVQQIKNDVARLSEVACGLYDATLMMDKAASDFLETDTHIDAVRIRYV